MLSTRQERVLQHVAEQYIHSAKPVASSIVAQRVGCSPATVRSEFAALEELGLLAQPHTSAGRVPTPAGFILYAQRLLPPRPLPDAAQRRLDASLSSRHGSNLLRSLASATAQLSGYAVMLELPGDGTVRALEVHLSPLSERQVLAVAVLENGLTRDLSIELDPTPDADVLGDVERMLRELSLPLTAMPEAMRRRARMLSHELRRTLDALADAWPALHPAEMVSQGLSLLFDEPESNDPSFLRRVALRLEHGASAWRASTTEPVTLAYDEDVALIGADLPWVHGPGRLTLVGPARMHYERAFSVAYGASQSLHGADISLGGIA